MFSGVNTTLAHGRGAYTTTPDQRECRINVLKLPQRNLSMHSVLFHADLSGCLHRAPNFYDAFRGMINVEEVISLGQFQMSHL